MRVLLLVSVLALDANIPAASAALSWLGVPSLEAQKGQLKYWQEQYDAAAKGK